MLIRRPLIITCILLLGHCSLTYAMGGTPPKTEEPKYKLEITKMEMVPGTPAISTAETAVSSGEGKYKVEILKMNFISAPTSSEAPVPTCPKQ